MTFERSSLLRLASRLQVYLLKGDIFGLAGFVPGLPFLPVPHHKLQCGDSEDSAKETSLPVEFRIRNGIHTIATDPIRNEKTACTNFGSSGFAYANLDSIRYKSARRSSPLSSVEPQATYFTDGG